MTMNEYTDEELLPLSGIQHFCFCRRQWALIHVERQWKENVLTVEGKGMHDRVDDPYFSETRRDLLVTRSMPVISYQLGLQGVCDVVEFKASPDGANLFGRQGTYLPAPVEYKHGHKKFDRSDAAQVCAQAICLEEMLSVQIPTGYLYYAETRHREEIQLDDELRMFVIKMTNEMHAYFSRGYTPKVKASKACRSCSMKEICLPEIQGRTISATTYIQHQIGGE